ncbi:serine/threonine-protein kinase [Lyngbya sp. PCC 8106]|uniref:serine/threonine protein kinase n=1 Tax=Lyngbya sp. (strain PCC 8106) TaxID=313612 RepID=UPI0000EAB71F|nr:serine/threonine-protein kinase [Lyngbya sp. PCC 8106]EAW33717.1 serine/threonine kinase [Lyngbya sp. PCC 8106]
MSSKAETILNNGQYKIERVLGRGEYGITYGAVDIRRQQMVAIKTVNPNLRHHTEFAQFQYHFKAVARCLSQCQHPNLVKVLEVFEDRGLPFMVMNYISGQPLIDSLGLGSQLSVTQAVRFIRQIAVALSEIHQQGIIHCNLTPEVIVRAEQTEQLILTDFGIASRLTDAMTQPYLGSRSLSGGYAALEQYLPHEKLTTATDIYSLAAILYWLLTGTPPLEAPLCLSGVTETLLSPSKPSLRQLRPDLSPTLERVILWGLELEQQHRPQSLEQWLAFLPELEDYSVVESGVTEDESDQVTTSSVGSHAGDHHRETSSESYSSGDQTDNKQFTPLFRFSSIPGFVPFVFMITAMFSGCVGFYLTRVYGGVQPQTTVLQPEKSFDQQFPDYDPSKPVFQEPSVKSQLVTDSITGESERDFDYRDSDILNGKESTRQMASEEAWTEDYTSDWTVESEDYQTVESQPSSIDGYYSESQTSTTDSYSSDSSSYSSEYSRDQSYPSSYSSNSSEYSTPNYPQSSYSTSTPVRTTSNDYPSPATLDSPRYSSEEYPRREIDSTTSPSSVESNEYYSPSYPASSELYNSVETDSNFPNDLPMSSEQPEESPAIPSSSYSDPYLETEMEYKVPDETLSIPKFETQSELPRSESEIEFTSGGST